MDRTMARIGSANPSLHVAATLMFAALFTSPSLLSAQNLPAPSRTMYKCKVNGTTSYSDIPCLGAEKLEVEPTRGVGKISGTERTGNDVFRERLHENFVKGVRPLTGMDLKQFSTAER